MINKKYCELSSNKKCKTQKYKQIKVHKYQAKKCMYEFYTI